MWICGAMGGVSSMWSRIKKFFKRSDKTQVTLTEKEQATRDNKPWVSVLSFNVNPNDLGMGSFELDWNAEFVKSLRMMGYRGETDEQLVEQWFNGICRNVLLNTWEEDQTDLTGRLTQRKRRDDGKYEFS